MRNDPCATCPSNPDNKEAVETLASLQPEEHAALTSAVMAKLRSLDKEIHGDNNGYRGNNARIYLLEEQVKWRDTSSDKWLGRLGMIVTVVIAVAALLLTTWDILTR